jgi:hypothetical protein
VECGVVRCSVVWWCGVVRCGVVWWSVEKGAYHVNYNGAWP